MARIVLRAPCLEHHCSPGDTGDTSPPRQCHCGTEGVYPMSLLPRDRLIEQLYGEITALKEGLENFKAEVGHSQVGRMRPAGNVG